MKQSQESIITTEHLSIETPTGRNIVTDLSISITPGIKLAVIGSEGAGKTTLLKAMAGIELSDFLIKGNIVRGNVGYFAQQMDEVWFKKTISQYMLSALTDAKDEKWEDYNKAYQALITVGLDPSFLEQNRVINSLSGGENVRLRLAKILMQDPKVILLDEPTNYLDLEILRWMKNFIKETEKPIIFASHDEALIENCANQILYLHYTEWKNESRYIYSGTSYEEFKISREREYQASEDDAQKKNIEVKKLKKSYTELKSGGAAKEARGLKSAEGMAEKNSAMRAAGKKQRKLEKLRNQIEELEKSISTVERDDTIKIDFPQKSFVPKGKKIIDFQISKLVYDDKILAKDIHLTILGPEKIFIIGKNGSGKSTLIRQIFQFMEKDSSVSVNYVPQNSSEILKDSTKSAAIYLDEIQEDRTLNRTILRRMGFQKESIDFPIERLSGGQITKLMLSRAMASGANVLILDEPTTNLSPLSNPILHDSLKSFPGAVIAVSHDLTFIEHVATQIYELTPQGLAVVSKQDVLTRFS